MTTIILDEKKLAARLKQDAAKSSLAIEKAIRAGLQRSRTWILKKTPVDRGILRNAWMVFKTENGYYLENDQPYAGVIERGSRPFKMSPEGIWALKAWAMRKLISGEIQSKSQASRSSVKTRKLMKKRKTPELEKEAENIAYAIAKTFAREGRKGKYFVWKELPAIEKLVTDEFDRYMANFFNRSSSGIDKP